MIPALVLIGSIDPNIYSLRECMLVTTGYWFQALAHAPAMDYNIFIHSAYTTRMLQPI